MPNPQEAADPFDVMEKGIPFDAKKLAGEPAGQQLSKVAEALGIADKDLPEDEEEIDEEEESPQAKGTGSKDAKAKADALENYSAQVQEKSEELYALNLSMAKDNPEHIEKLIKSSNPLDQRMAKKLLDRNDFGAKTIEEFKKMQARKSVGDDPVKQELADIKSSLEELRNERKIMAWNDWKKENAIKGDAAKLADDFHARYPDADNADIVAYVRGKMGVSNGFSMKSSSFAGSRGDMPETTDEELDFSSPVAKGMMKNVDLKKLRKFTRQAMAR